ncbi:MAG: SIMPL domain-containing protein [Calditrichaeota bacterium]|nr:MAG: SIMPL domain-containing protein [Calditrichota bacterium]
MQNQLNNIILAIGIALAGLLIGLGFIKSKTADNFVKVKGVSEREVKANIAFWPLRFVATDDNLNVCQRKINESKNKILAFLKKYGIEESQTELQSLEVTDILANAYRNGPTDNRYIINQTIMVRSENPELIQNASQKVSDLVEVGVILSSSGGYGYYGGMAPTFLFTELNDLKPEMIAEATANARNAAEKFALDSGSQVGGIRRANQGVFVILPRDRAPGIMQENQLYKIVRVVSTIDYYLEN